MVAIRIVLPATLILTASGSACGRGSGAPAPGPAPAPGTRITADDIQRTPSASLEQLLMARVPGIMLVRDIDGRMVIQIRGQTTIVGRREPLFVVNGIALEPNPAGNLTAINVEEIESIEVLKDAVSTAMYGARGANGVIVIRTKTSR